MGNLTRYTTIWVKHISFSMIKDLIKHFYGSYVYLKSKLPFLGTFCLAQDQQTNKYGADIRLIHFEHQSNVNQPFFTRCMFGRNTICLFTKDDTTVNFWSNHLLSIYKLYTLALLRLIVRSFYSTSLFHFLYFSIASSKGSLHRTR